MDKIKSLYDRVQNLTGAAKYVAWSLAGILIGIAFDFVPGPFFGAVWVFPVMGLVLGVSEAFQSERHRKHPKPPPPLGPPTRRSPF